MLKAKTPERGFIRDLMNGALLNTDNEALRLYKARRDDKSAQRKLHERVVLLEGVIEELLKERQRNLK